MADMVAVADLKHNDFIMNQFGGALKIVDISPAIRPDSSIDDSSRLKIAVYGECGSAGSCRHAFVMDGVYSPQSMMEKSPDPKW